MKVAHYVRDNDACAGVACSDCLRKATHIKYVLDFDTMQFFDDLQLCIVDSLCAECAVKARFSDDPSLFASWMDSKESFANNIAVHAKF